MRTKVFFLLLAGGLLALAACLVNRPNRVAQANEIPERYRETVRKGLEYLVKHQFKDGHWEGDGGRHPVAMTGLVGLALHMEPSLHTRWWAGFSEKPPVRKYSANLQLAADWIMSNAQARDGLIFSGHPSETDRYMEGHGARHRLSLRHRLVVHDSPTRPIEPGEGAEKIVE
jgi:hypothetical protein